MIIYKGSPVEFTDVPCRTYPPADPSLVRFGVSIAEVDDETDDVRVMLANRSIVTARYIHACDWAGWLPEGLDVIYEEFNRDASTWADESEYL